MKETGKQKKMFSRISLFLKPWKQKKAWEY